jgi:hypothetical protein
VGANNHLKELGKVLMSNEFDQNVIHDLINKKIAWHFIPPKNPYMGGLWEAGIKTVKNHIKKVCGNATLTFEELYTLLTRIEACVNSRPLTPWSSSPNDLTPLTPGHFLIGEALTAPVESNVAQVNLNWLSRWQRIEQLRQHFWMRWSKEYVTQSTYSREEGNGWEKDRRNKIPNVKIRQTIAQESVWKALLTSFCISRAVTA